MTTTPTKKKQKEEERSITPLSKNAPFSTAFAGAEIYYRYTRIYRVTLSSIC